MLLGASDINVTLVDSNGERMKIEWAKNVVRDSFSY